MSEEQRYLGLHKKGYLLVFLSGSPRTDCVSNGTIVYVPVTHILQFEMCKHIGSYSASVQSRIPEGYLKKLAGHFRGLFLYALL